MIALTVIVCIYPNTKHSISASILNHTYLPSDIRASQLSIHFLVY
jgi:hypothetical protein